MALEQEIWKNEVLKKFRAIGSHFDGTPDYSSDVMKGKVIHLADIGADPAVLVNNTSYPMASVVQTDSDVPLTLDRLDTENTKIQSESTKGLSYDKKGVVIETHTEALNETFLDKATHAVAPLVHSTGTPVLVTTGAARPVTGRKRLEIKNIISLKAAYDANKIPKVGRRLLLCPEHVEDLLLVSESFDKQYNVDRKEGVIGKLYGFDIYEYPNLPVYDPAVATGTKKAFGSAVLDTDAVASISYFVPRLFKAIGQIEPYLRDAKDDPENRATTVGFRLWGILLPKLATGVKSGIGAIRSDF